jgi:hypothetical protein
MNRLREFLSAWAVVALLAATILAVWGVDAMTPAPNGTVIVACNTHGEAAVAVELPRRTGWAPDAVLAGLPDSGNGQTSYELSEERSVQRYQGDAPEIRMASGGMQPDPEPSTLC